MRILLALTLLAALTAGAQQKLDVTVRQVNDRRTTGSFAALGITVELPKLTDAEVAGSRVLVARAIDDAGNDLVDRESEEPQLQTNPRLGLAIKPSPATVLVSLKNPDRKAKTVKEVSGEIELFLPSKDPNSVAEVAGFMPQSGKPLAHKALKANGVEITFLTAAQIDAEKKRRAAAKRKEYAEMGYDDAEAVESMVASDLESAFPTDENELLARVKDPNQRIQDVSYIDANGETQMVIVREEDGLARFSSWSGRPQPGWKLRVAMRTPKNLVRYSFALKDVPLP